MGGCNSLMLGYLVPVYQLVMSQQVGVLYHMLQKYLLVSLSYEKYGYKKAVKRNKRMLSSSHQPVSLTAAPT